MKRMVMMLLAGLLGTGAFAATTVDGSRRATCATEELRDCVAGSECLNGLPAEYGAPTSLRIDFRGRQILGEHRNTRIRDFERKDGQLLLQGRELGYAWTLGIDEKTGEMTMSLVNREGAFVLFGRCTAA